jgi:hypothetical protein
MPSLAAAQQAGDPAAPVMPKAAEQVANAVALNHDPLPSAFQRPQLRCMYYNEAG